MLQMSTSAARSNCTKPTKISPLPVAFYPDVQGLYGADAVVADVGQGIEIGAVELNDRKLTNVHFHRYINPEREIDDAALEVHGITAEFLADKPRFEEVAEEFAAFIEGAL